MQVRSALAALVAAVALFLAACGGSDEPVNAGPQLGVRKAGVAWTQPSAVATWEAKTIEATVLQGTATSASIFLQLKESLEDASLFVVPEIAQFVDVSLGGRTRLTQGNFRIPIAFDVPAATPLGTYEGTIHLRSGSATVPATLKVVLRVVTASADSIPPGVADPASDRWVQDEYGQFVVSDELVVVIKQDVVDSDARIRAIANATGSAIVGSIPRDRLYQLRFPGANADLLSGIAAQLRTLDGVRSASRHFDVTDPAVIAPAFPNDGVSAISTAWLKDSWETDFKAGDANGFNRHLEFIRAPQAWGYLGGIGADGTIADARGNKIAVIDKEFDWMHPDLMSDAQRGHVVRKFTSSGDPLADDDFFYVGKFANRSDELTVGHGTKVTGVICALGNNNQSVIGTAGRCELDLYAYSEGLTVHRSAVRLSEAIGNAIENGARVISISLQLAFANCVRQPLPAAEKDRCPSDAKRLERVQEANDNLRGAFDRAKDRGVLVVVAAGNERSDVKFASPASLGVEYPGNVITVGGAAIPDPSRLADVSSVPLDEKSNYGAGIDVAAPMMVTTTKARACSVKGGEPQPVCPADQFLSLSNVEGTSVAAPQVAGLAALVMKKHAGKSVADVKECIVKGAATAVAGNAWTRLYGSEPRFKVIDALNAVACSPPEITTDPQGGTFDEGQTASFVVGVQGIGTLTYQWKKNGVPIDGLDGGTFSTYTTPPLKAEDNGSAFTVVVSNAFGSVTSAEARVTVRPVAPPPTAVQTLASGLGYVFNLTVADGQIVWLESNGGFATTVMSMPISGLQVPKTLTAGLSGSPSDVRVVDGEVFFSTQLPGFDGRVGKVSLSGGSTTILSGASQPYNIAVDSTFVYWSEEVGVGDHLQGIRKVPRAGGPATDVYMPGRPRSMVLVGRDLFAAIQDIDTSQMRLVKVNVDSGAAEVLSNIPTGTTDLAVAGAYVYGTDSHFPDGKIWRVPLSGGTPEVILSGLSRPERLALHAGVIYWSEYTYLVANSSTVKGMQIGSAVATTIATGLTGVGDIFADNTGVYWSEAGVWGNGTNGAIKRAPLLPSPAGTITTVAGNGTTGFIGDGVQALDTGLVPRGTAVDSAGNLYVADYQNDRIRKVAPDGVISTLPGNDGILAGPWDVALDKAGNLYFSDYFANRIRKRSPDGTIATVTTAVANPTGIGFDSAGNLYIAEYASYKIRKLSPSGSISDFASIAVQNGPPTGLAVDASGNVFVTAFHRHVVIKISPDGTQTVVAGGGTAYPDDGVQATSASLNRPYAVKVDPFGNLYIADSLNHRIRKVGVDGIIRTVAGNGLMGWSGDNGAAIEASLDTPEHVSIGPTGDLYVTTRNRVRKVVGACCGP